MKKLNKNEQEIYNLLEQELLKDEKAQDLRSTTEICEEENYNYRAGYEMPRDFQCGGVRNAGLYMRVDTDGYIRPMVGQGGEGGYEPDFATIELNEDGELAVVDYISATSVEELLENVVSLTGNETITGRKTFTQPIGIGNTAYTDGRILVNVEGSVKNIYLPTTSGNLAIESGVQDNFCLESFAVELDERLEVVEEDLTEINPIVARALLTPLTRPTTPELVGIDTTNTQARVKIGSGLGYDTNTDTLYATGGGGGGTVYNITGSLNYQEQSITITSPSYKTAIEEFFDENGYFPEIKLSLDIYAGGQLVQKGEYNKVNADITNNTLHIGFGETELDEDNKLGVRQVYFVDSGSTMSATFSDMSTESFSSDKYYDRITIEDKLGEKVALTGIQTITGIKYFTNPITIGSQGGLGYFPSCEYDKDHIKYSPTSGNNYTLSFPSKTGTIALTSDIPTKTSDLTNDSGFITAQDIPTIPTKTSELQNDSNFTNKNYVDTQVATKSPKLYLHHLTINTENKPYTEEGKNATFRIMILDTTSSSYSEVSQFTQNGKKAFAGTLTKSGGSEVANFNPLKKSGLSVLYFTKADGTEISFSAIELVGSITSDTVVSL